MTRAYRNATSCTMSLKVSWALPSSTRCTAPALHICTSYHKMAPIQPDIKLRRHTMLLQNYFSA